MLANVPSTTLGALGSLSRLSVMIAHGRAVAVAFSTLILQPSVLAETCTIAFFTLLATASVLALDRHCSTRLALGRLYAVVAHLFRL